jgi:hypothetical protein
MNELGGACAKSRVERPMMEILRLRCMTLMLAIDNIQVLKIKLRYLILETYLISETFH